MLKNASDLRKGKNIEANQNTNFNGKGGIEMDTIESLSEQTITALAVEVTSADPFNLLEHYKGNFSSSSRPYHPIQLPKGSDKDTAQAILISALKIGDDRFMDLVNLLLDETPLYTERQAELNKLFAENQKILLPIKQHLCILSAMQDILRDVRELLRELNSPVVDSNEFYQRLIGRLGLAKDDYIRGQFNINLGDYLKDEKSKEQARVFCLQALQNYLPHTLEQAYTSYFALSEEGNTAFLMEKIEQAITDFDSARDNAQKFYEHHCKPVAEFEAQLARDKRTRREELVTKIMETKDKELKAGVPYLYKDQITGESLNRLASLVPYNAIDPQSADQSNLALITLQYDNNAIYKEFFSSHKHLAETAKINQVGLSAEHYDKKAFWQDPADKEKSAVIIKKKDSKGELLRTFEKGLHQYLQNWHKMNGRLRQAEENEGLIEKIMVGLINLFNNQALFVKRQEEANEYLLLVQKAMKDIPTEFFQGLEKILNESNWGALGGSQLHNMVDRYRKAIQSNSEYRILVNPTPELIERVKALEEKIRQSDLQHQQDLLQQKEEYERTLKENQETIAVQVRQENSELKMRLQAQEQRAQVQEQRAQVQEQQMQAQQQQIQAQQQQIQAQQQRAQAQEQLAQQRAQVQEQQMQAILARLSQMEQKQSPSDGASGQPSAAPDFFKRNIG